MAEEEQRISPLDKERLILEDNLLLGETCAAGSAPVTLVSTLAHSPGLLTQVTRMAGMFHNCSITPVEREFIILRVAAFCRSHYMYAEHVPEAAKAGLSKTDVECLWSRTTHALWSKRRVSLLNFTNDLLANDSLSEHVWSAVSRHYDATQLVELISLIGFYRMIAGFTNAVQMSSTDFDGHLNIFDTERANRE